MSHNEFAGFSSRSTAQVGLKQNDNESLITRNPTNRTKSSQKPDKNRVEFATKIGICHTEAKTVKECHDCHRGPALPQLWLATEPHCRSCGLPLTRILVAVALPRTRIGARCHMRWTRIPIPKGMRKAPALPSPEQCVLTHTIRILARIPSAKVCHGYAPCTHN